MSPPPAPSPTPPPTRHSVKITLGGTELTVSSEHPPEYTKDVAAYYDAVLSRIRGSASVDAHRAALLAGLAITDELFQSRLADGDHATRLKGLNDRVARLLPPTKRGGAHKGA